MWSLSLEVTYSQPINHLFVVKKCFEIERENQEEIDMPEIRYRMKTELNIVPFRFLREK